MTLSDEEARRRGTRKTVLERKAPPTFDVVVEIHDRDRLAIHKNVAEVDRRAAARVSAAAGDPPASAQRRGYGRPGSRYRNPCRSSRTPTNDRVHGDERERALSIFPYGVSRNKIERAIHNLRVNASIARTFDEADVVLTLKTLERKQQPKLKQIASDNVPIYSIKTNTTTQIQTALRDVFNLGSIDHEEIALREAEEAIYQVLLTSQAIELSPQTSYVRRMQHQLAERYRLQSRSTGLEPNRRVRIFKTLTKKSTRRAPDSPKVTPAFVVVEGIEGSGKSTLLAGLTARLSTQNRDVAVTREPGGTPVGEAVRSIFLDRSIRIDPLTEALLINAARSAHVLTVIRPALEAGRIVFATATSTRPSLTRDTDAA